MKHNSFSSLLFDSTKFNQLQKINEDFYTGINVRQNIQNTIRLFKFPMNSLENQKIFFDEVETCRKINFKPFVRMTGFSLAFQSPEDNNYYPAISYKKMPTFQFNNIIRKQQNHKTFTPTQKSIIAFTILVGLEILSQKEDINFLFNSESIYFTSERIPVLFYTSFNPKKTDSNFYWLPPEYQNGKSFKEESLVYSFGMMLYELLGENPDFFKQSKKDFDLFIKTKKMPQISEKCQFSSFISLCINTNSIERPTFSRLLMIFNKNWISFPGTNMEEFMKYKRTFYKKIDRNFDHSFYTESYLRLKSLKGSIKEKLFLAETLLQKLDENSESNNEENTNIKEEFMSLILSLFQSSPKEATDIYLRYFSHHISDAINSPLKPPINALALTDENTKKLYDIYKLAQGNIYSVICSSLSFDPITQIEYAKSLLQSSNVSNETNILAFCLLSSALVNPKLDIDSKNWITCLSKLKQLTSNSNVVNYVNSNSTDPEIILAFYACIGSKEFEVESLAKENIPIANYLIARRELIANRISESVFRLKKCNKFLHAISSYTLGIAYLRSGNNLASYTISSCLCSSDPSSRLFQMAAESMAEMNFSNPEVAIMYLSIAPRMTERKKLLLALLTIEMSKKKSTETAKSDSDSNNNDNSNNELHNQDITISSNINLPMPLSEANEYLSKSLYPLTVMHRFCEAFLQKAFARDPKETNNEYRARFSGVQHPFLLGCRLFVGFCIQRNYFLSEKYFFQQGKYAPSAYQLGISSNIINACYDIIKWEDFREPVPPSCVAILINYLKCKDSEKVQPPKIFVSKPPPFNLQTKKMFSNSEKIKEALEIKNKIDKIIKSNSSITQLTSIGMNLKLPEPFPVVKNKSQEKKKIFGNEEEDLSEEEIDILLWFKRNWKIIEPILKSRYT